MIPKIIHHIWPGNDIFKEKFHDFRLSWMKYNIDWTFYFWRLDNLPLDLDQRILNIIHNPAYNHTVKSDILRFEIVRCFGGIYVDTDMECLKSLNDFLTYNFFAGKEDDTYICPSIFGSTKQNSILSKIINKSIENITKNSIEHTNKYPNMISGVMPFHDTIINESDNIQIFNSNYFYPVHYKNKNLLKTFYPDAYTKHYWSGKDIDGWAYNL